MCALTIACGGGSSGDTGGTSAGPASSGGDPTEGVLVALAEPMLWKAVAAADDPLATHRPATVMCPLGSGWLVEDQGFEVNTQACNYAMFSQPALAAVVPGARIVGSLYHFDLVSAEPATAHAALQVGETLIWEQEIAIPGPANAFTIDVPASFAADAGAPVYFHLHNHGQNNWTLGKLEVEAFGG